MNLKFNKLKNKTFNYENLHFLTYILLLFK